MSILFNGFYAMSGKVKNAFYDLVGDNTQRIKHVDVQNILRNVAIDEGLSFKTVNDFIPSNHPCSGMDYETQTLIFEGNGKYCYVLPLSHMDRPDDIKNNISMCVEHANANDIKNFSMEMIGGAAGHCVLTSFMVEDGVVSMRTTDPKSRPDNYVRGISDKNFFMKQAEPFYNHLLNELDDTRVELHYSSEKKVEHTGDQSLVDNNNCGFYSTTYAIQRVSDYIKGKTSKFSMEHVKAYKDVPTAELTAQEEFRNKQLEDYNEDWAGEGFSTTRDEIDIDNLERTEETNTEANVENGEDYNDNVFAAEETDIGYAGQDTWYSSFFDFFSGMCAS